mgnify:CR=1 FL=1
MADFAGFTNDQMFKLAQMKGYTGNNNIEEVNNFIMGNDKAKSYVMEMFNEATTLVGRQKRGFMDGGLAEMNKYISGSSGDYKDLSTFENYDFSGAPFTKEEWMAQAKAEGAGSNTQQATDMNVKFGSTVAGATTFTPDPVTTNTNTNTTTDTTATNTTDTTGTTVQTPQNFAKLATSTPVNQITVKPGDKTLVGEGTGQISGTPDSIDIGDISDTKTVDTTAGQIDAAQMKDEDISKVADTIDENLKDVKAVKGTVSDEAQVKAETMNPEDLAALDLKAAQIDEATTVKAPDKRTVQDDELVQSAYDKEKADDVIKKTEAAFVTADPSTKAMVKGQLDELMSDFEPGRTPPWAAGAMRTALAAMNARGLNASSLAGQAIVQAAMESALPIAKADAKTVADFELQNLNNRQQATILAAKQRADFLGIEFDQEFRARVKNASTISDIAKQNYDADVQIALENARMAQSVDIANLNAENAKIISDAAALTKLDIQNLTNKQQAQLANAEAFLEMDIQNLKNEQQVSILKSQAKIDALFNDQAAENAAKQLNIVEKNKVDVAMANLQASQERFNAEQQNVMAQVQFKEDAALTKFFASLKENRAQFNATNALAVSTANAAWYQSVTNFNNGALNQANMNDANNSTALTKMQLEQDYQAARDLMNWAFTADQNELQRAASIFIAQLDADAKQAEANGGFFQTMINAIANIPS